MQVWVLFDEEVVFPESERWHEEKEKRIQDENQLAIVDMH